MLTDMEFLKDGRTLDPAAWQDWLDAIKEVLKEENNKKVS
ncbi:hypothetical protein Noda2021_00490 [Candidatus Dependentiae bacterium Noda2021]|nr:hypothetical protein Noda2021_00490 [Candidatus Dependentiae bacterium Noda2021]